MRTTAQLLPSCLFLLAVKLELWPVYTTINISDDEYIEGKEEFFVHIEVNDLNIKVPKLLVGLQSTLQIMMVISCPFFNQSIVLKLHFVTGFEIQFNADTPMVNGDSVLLSFSSTAPVDEATCTVTFRSSILAEADCKFVR